MTSRSDGAAEPEDTVDRAGTRPSRSPRLSQPDPLVLALARYVQALDRRYPGGPDQLRRVGLDARANMPTVPPQVDGPAA